MEDASAPGTATAFDRSAEERTDPDLIARLIADTETRVLLIDADRAPVDARGGLLLVTVPAACDVLATLAEDAGARAATAPTREVSEASERFAFLGRRDGVAVLLAAVPGAADLDTAAAGATGAPTSSAAAGAASAPASTAAGTAGAVSTAAGVTSTAAGTAPAPAGTAPAPAGTAADPAGAAEAATAVAVADQTAPTAWVPLRALHPALGSSDGALLLEAVSLARWLLDAGHCPFCGAPAALTTAGWARSCTACGREHFPRTDPAVIVAVTDGDRILLGSNAMWEQRRYSCFAGFVEAGESLEEAVRRELREEAGIDAEQVTYAGSQAWPFPRSLMLGFRARARDARTAQPDGEEILDVRWFTRAEIRDAYDGASDILLPGKPSIAHELISSWAAEPDSGSSGPTPGARA